MRTSFHHQSEAQPPNGPLTAATSPDTPSTCPATQSGLHRYLPEQIFPGCLRRAFLYLVSNVRGGTMSEQAGRGETGFHRELIARAEILP